MKVVLNKYLAGQLSGVAGNLNPVSTLVTTTTRTWTDANRNYVPDCDLIDHRAPTANACALSNPNFGTVVPRLHLRSRADCAGGASATTTGSSRPACSSSLPPRMSARRRLFPSLVRQLHRDRQPGRDASDFDHVQHHRAGRSAAAGRRRARRSPALQRRTRRSSACRRTTT